MERSTGRELHSEWAALFLRISAGAASLSLMVEAEFGRLFISMMQRKRHLQRSSATYRASTTSPMISRRAYPWLPYLAEALAAPPPRHVPRFLARLAVGEPGIVLMTEVRGASNTKAKRELSWHPHWSSWRDGFLEEIAPKRRAG